jgi:hypothetical protein
MGESDPLIAPAAFVASGDYIELLDESRATDVAAARARERGLRRVAEETAELAGTLVDLAEQRAPVAVGTLGGRRHHAAVVGVGGDYCVLRTGSGAEIHLRLDAITTVRPQPGDRQDVASGARRPVTDRLLTEVLGRLAGERRRVSLVTRTGEVVAGELRAVGTDVISVRLDGAGGDTCYVAAATLSEVLVED